MQCISLEEFNVIPEFQRGGGRYNKIGKFKIGIGYFLLFLVFFGLYLAFLIWN